ncbi:MAG: hypothetical protein ABSC51_07965 [Gaiellaceae bacterium]
MPGETSPPPRTRPSGRVWFVLACAAAVIAFLAATLPGVYNVKHGRREYVVKDRIERIVFVSKGTGSLHISPSHDGRVHVTGTSSISHDSRLIERHRVVDKTLTLTSSCTGSRFGILRRCNLNFRLQVPPAVALSIRTHIGKTTIRGVRGRLDFKSDVGIVDGSGCFKQAHFSLGFGGLKFHDSCVPELLRVRARAGDVELTVPAGRYAVDARTHHGGGVKRPFANIIEDPAAHDKLDIELSWGGAIKIDGAGP